MPEWKSYEDVATYLLNEFAAHFGLDHVEGKQAVPGLRSGTEWAIDAKGWREGNDGFVIVECRRYTTSRQNQEKIGGLAYRIMDTGAKGAIIVSPLGLQEGAALVAKAEGITTVQLNANSTEHEYVLQFLNQIMVGLHDQITISDSVTFDLRHRP